MVKAFSILEGPGEDVLKIKERPGGTSSVNLIAASATSSTERVPNAANMPVVLDVRVVTETGGGPDKTILNSPQLLEPMGYRNLCAYMHPPGDPGFEVLEAGLRPGMHRSSRSPIAGRGTGGSPHSCSQSAAARKSRSGTVTTTRATFWAWSCDDSVQCGS
jgi:hypothetical protein